MTFTTHAPFQTMKTIFLFVLCTKQPTRPEYFFVYGFRSLGKMFIIGSLDRHRLQVLLLRDFYYSLKRVLVLYDFTVL